MDQSTEQNRHTVHDRRNRFERHSIAEGLINNGNNQNQQSTSISGNQTHDRPYTSRPSNRNILRDITNLFSNN